ncbi:MAG: ABC transporter ATP-binding protein [Planctomycetaceae bacterium]
MGISVCLLIQTAYWVATPLCLSHLIDEGLLKKQESVLYSILLIMVVITVIGNIAGVVADWLSAKALSELLRRLRADMFEHLQRLSLSFYARTSEGDIVARFSSDATTVEEVTGSFIPWVIMPGLAALGSMVALFQMDWRLAMFSMLVWPCSLFGPRVSANRAMDASIARYNCEAATLSQIQENVSAQPVIKAFVLGDYSINAFGKHNSLLSRLATRMHFLCALVDRSSKIGTAFLQLIVLGLSTLLAFRGELTVGQLTAFQSLFLLLASNVDYVIQYIPTLIRATGGLRRIDSLLKTQPDVPDRAGAAERVSFEEALSLDHVTFSYDGSSKTLDDVSLSIPRNSYVAIVGPNGCGKSTILKLLMRFHDPQEGAVRIDAVDIRDIRQDAYRSLLAPVLQESFLFNATIRENIRLGRLDATDEEIEAAARAVEFDAAIRQMLDGYDTIVGHRGSRLSGGERQRVAIARAILRNPAILILDETTSALDAPTELAVNELLFRLSRNRTIISVTHRLSVAPKYDRIFVLNDGHLVEQGSHAELLKLGGVYADLWNKQQDSRNHQHSSG